ncbi:MAG: histidine kinase N-terminal 7TM domain-containing protein, partial [Elusimicrobiota bacterium]
MNLLSLLKFFVFTIYLWLIVFVIYKSPRAKLNRICAFFIFSLALWAFSDSFVHSASSKQQALMWENLSSIGWISFPVLFLWQTLIISKKKKILNSWVFYIIIFSVPAFFVYTQWSGYLINDYVMAAYGWRSIWSDSIWPYFFYLYYASSSIISVSIYIKHKKKIEDLHTKKQLKIIFTTFIMVFVLATATDVLAPELGFQFIPPLGVVFALIWATGLVYAITEYGFMSITPARAAADIISSMGEALIIIDMEKIIVSFNRAAEKLLGYDEGEIKGKEAEIL